MATAERTADQLRQEWQAEQVAAGYDQRRFTSLGGRLHNFLERDTFARLLGWADRRQKIQTVLDVACGTGRISEVLLESGYKVTCGDISESMMDMARARLNRFGSERLAFTKLDAFNLAFTDASFDCCTCARFFQHLTSVQRAQALSELARVSRRWVVANFMYTSTYYGIVRRVRKALRRYAPRQTASRAQIDTELGQAGLRIVRERFTQPGYNGNLVLLLEKTG